MSLFDEQDDMCDMCLLAAGIPRRGVRGQTFYTKTGHFVTIERCNPHASRLKWTVIWDGRHTKCSTEEIDWATGPVPV